MLFGGQNDAGLLDDTWAWTSAGWQRRTTAVSPPARSRHALADSVAQGPVLLYGGESDTELDDAWEWNGAGWNPSTIRGNPGPRAGHAIARRDHLVVCFGGVRGAWLLQDTWLVQGPLYP